MEYNLILLNLRGLFMTSQALLLNKNEVIMVSDLAITTPDGKSYSSGEKIFYVYLPLYVGFAPTNTDFSDISEAATDNGFKKYYSSVFTKNISMTTTEDGCDIFVLVPENKTLNGFTYSSSNLTVPFDKLEGTFKYKTDLGDFKYNVYRSSNTNGGMSAGNTYDKINITL
jgi:hypothetical protein